MSTEIAVIRNSGSRDVDLHVGHYYGGVKKQDCIQLSADMEVGGVGYVQLSYEDWLVLCALIPKKWRQEK